VLGRVEGKPHRRIALSLAASIARLQDGKVTVAEVGVSTGVLSEMLLRYLPQGFVVMVDRWDTPPPDKRGTYEASGDRFARRPREVHDGAYSSAVHRTNFARHRRRILRKESEQAASEFPDASFDMVFIDGGHYYEQVKLDLAAWWPKLREGGVFSGHDYGGRYLGVQQAVDEFCLAQQAELWQLSGSVWYAQKPYSPRPAPLLFPQWDAQPVFAP
jgi:hypothetical protein